MLSPLPLHPTPLSPLSEVGSRLPLFWDPSEATEVVLPTCDSQGLVVA